MPSAAIPTRTPPFLAWALEQDCALRQRCPSLDPLAVERHLRPIRCWSAGANRGHVIDDVCVGQHSVSPTQELKLVGFPVAETLRRYGGEPQIESTCRACPANIETVGQSHTVAGCFGWLAFDDATADDLDRIWEATEQSRRLPSRRLQDECDAHFPRTTPPWYGLFCRPRLDGDALGTLHRILQTAKFAPGFESEHPPGTALQRTALQRAETPEVDALARFVKAVDTAVIHHLKLRCELVPSGQRAGRTWTVDAHCDFCRAARTPDTSRCPVCGKSGGAAPPSVRRARGLRPFMPLEVFLSPARVDDIHQRLANTSIETSNIETSNHAQPSIAESEEGD